MMKLQKGDSMRSASCSLQPTLWLVVAGIPLAALAQNAPRIAPVPRDTLELAAGGIQVADTPAKRDAALQVLTRARNSYALRKLRQPWDLKVHFSVQSQGRTNYDGDWEMEDVFSPEQGLHWTAKSGAGFSIAGIFGTSATYEEATTGVIPLRLQEARAMLYNPIPSIAYANNGSIRTLETSFQGSRVTCVLLSRSHGTSVPPDQRAWEESEECVDSQSGLLRLHSEVPGRYAAYDYTNSPQLGSHILPRAITISEGGRVVSAISVESLRSVPSVDPALFTPTAPMIAAGPAVAMGAATRLSRIPSPVSMTAGTSVRPICVFGLVTPSGRLVEAHSLQPSDPNSEAAVKDAEAIDFSPSMRAGTPPQQHFVFVIEKFAVSEK
jgi:hypothetical protein